MADYRCDGCGKVICECPVFVCKDCGRYPCEFNLDGGPQISKEQYEEEKSNFVDLKKIKDSNPKDAVGVRKGPVSTVSGAVVAELGLAMLEGARKYGRHNYREIGVRASVYRDATWRHLNKWWDCSEDIDPDSGLSHITKAIASLMVLRDAMIVGKCVDDRPPPVPISFLQDIDKKASDIIDKYPEAKEPFTRESVIKDD